MQLSYKAIILSLSLLCLVQQAHGEPSKSEKDGWIAEGQKLDGQSAGFFFKGNYKEAIEPLLKSTEFYVKALGPNHRWVGDNYSHIGTMYFKLNDYKNAERYYKLAMETFSKCGGSCQMGEAVDNYVTILKNTGRQQEAAKLVELNKGCPTTPVSSHNEPSPSLEKLRFLYGNWQGKSDTGTIIEEYWSAPQGDSIIGHCRFIKDGVTTFYELLTIVNSKRGIVLRMKHLDKDFKPWKESEEAGDCSLTKCTPGEIEFDNKNDKHRVTVSYKSTSADSLYTCVKDITGGKTSTYPFTYKRAKD